MKILIVSQYYYPEQFQINEIAPELVKRGHDVTVICGIPNYPKGKVFPGYEDKFEETICGVKVIRVKQIPRGHNTVQLIRNYWSYVRNANRYLSKFDQNFDVVLGYQLSPVTSMLPAIKYSKTAGIPSLLYVLDIWPASGQSHLLFNNGLLYKLLRNISQKIYRSADRLLVTSKPFSSYLEDVNKVSHNHIGYLPQHADSSMLSMDLSKETDSIINFMFAGNLGSGSKVDIIIKAANELKNRSDFKIHLVGDGSQRNVLEKLVSDLGLADKVVFHGNQKREDMPGFYKMADVLLLTLRGDNEVGNTMPGKLQMYMTAGKPILGAINGAAMEVINDSKCGKCVTAGNYIGLANLMQDYLDNRKAYESCGLNARKYFMQNFTLEKYINSLEQELLALIK